MITEFEAIYNDPYLDSYDRTANPDRLNVWQLTPDAIGWVSESGAHVLNFEEKGVGCVLNGACVIAVIGIFKNEKRNYAHFICQSGNIIKDVTIPSQIEKFKCFPFDVFLSYKTTTILYSSYISTNDFRVEYDSSFEVTEWSEFR